MQSLLANKLKRAHVIVTLQFDGSWSCPFDPKMKVKGMVWHNVTSPKKKTGTLLLASKVMETVFWDTGGMCSGDLLPRGETINIACYIWVLQKLLSALHDKCPLKTHTILQHKNAKLHTACLASRATEKYC
ncbi:hypothetical protein Cfor_12825 [Coptotermes formosanus]|jgi:hypothetical protein|uniref:Uncharacterized protein n=1 Tax=Coptotermes formosanus TaxID=36987 RepID=A0A6L2Q883_COPFO|nr:hypothetical protein Cfor_12825 [Coptotermes formosanus]